MLHGMDAQAGAAWVERVRQSLTEALSRRGTPTFTASFGISDSTMGHRMDQLMRLADEALYAAKQRGRDCVHLAEPMQLDRPPVRGQSEHNAAVDLRMLVA